MPPPPPPPSRTYTAPAGPEQQTLSSTVVSQYAVNLHERRGLMLSPDRRNFMQSMPFEAAMHVKGSSVPTEVTKRFAYTFKHEHYDPAKKPPRGRLDWIHDEHRSPTDQYLADDRRHESRTDSARGRYIEDRHRNENYFPTEREARYERVDDRRRYEVPEERSDRHPSRGRASSPAVTRYPDVDDRHGSRRTTAARDERRTYETDRTATRAGVDAERRPSRSRYEERATRHEERYTRGSDPETAPPGSSRPRSPRPGRV
jgi:hypothetical protein